MRKILIASFIATLAFLDSHATAAAEMTAGGLRCEYRENPLGIDVLKPRLSWVLNSRQRGQAQTAYQVIAATSAEKLARDEGDLWDSGKVGSDQSIHVEYSGRALTSGRGCYWKVRVWDKDERPSTWSEPGTWSMGLLEASDWQAKWIGAPPCQTKTKPGSDPPIPPSPLLRKSFDAGGDIRRATVYATALGVYELRINGRRVGNHILAPEWTDYHKRVQYQTFDVTKMLRKGKNVVGATLADGWYAGRLGPIEWNKNFPRRGVYGLDRRLLVRLDIEKTDGSRQTIVSGGSWKIDLDGPIRSADNFLGEIYDARKEQHGWDGPGFDDSQWKQATVDSSIHVTPSAQINEPIRVVKTLPTVSVTEPKAGVYVFDLGQNMVGWCSIRLNGPPGTEVTLRHGERLNKDGTVYTANLKSAVQTEKYTLDGRGPRDFQPHFTYHGFRYVQVTGLKQKPSSDILAGKVIASDSPIVGQFTCSNELLNQLWKNILWTQRGNMHSVPTDCPQRAERMGWMGDGQAFSQTGIFNMNMAAFYTKWIRDMRDAQFTDGRFPDYVPFPHAESYRPSNNMQGTPGWTDAGVIVPWNLYLNYADKRAIELHYPAAKRLIEFMLATSPDLIRRQTSGHGFDWLNGDMIDVQGHPKSGAGMPKELFGTAYFAHSVDIAARMASVLGHEEDSRRYGDLFERIKAAFNRSFVQADGRIAGNSQAAYALALHFNLLPEELRPKAAKHMVAAVGQRNGHPSTGIHATHRLMLELSRNGCHDEACRMINLRSMPSWGHMIAMGATTVWERWDGYVEGRGFQDPGMNSFNHPALGSVGEWIWRHVAGINPDEENPGYKHFDIYPRPGGDLSWAKAEYRSIRGPIVSDWRMENGHFTLNVTIPPNTTAEVHLPATDAQSVREGKVPAAEAEGVRLVSTANGHVVYAVQAGKYTFTSPPLQK